MNNCKSKGALYVQGAASELDYLTLDEQTAALDREAFLRTCEPDELEGAAEFLALAVRRRPGV